VRSALSEALLADRVKSAPLRLTAAAHARGVADASAPPWLVPLLDGTRDMETALHDARRLEPPHGPLEVVGLLASLQRAGVLEGWQGARPPRRAQLSLPLPGLGRLLSVGRLLSKDLPRRVAAVSLVSVVVVLAVLAATGQLGAILACFAARREPLVALLHLWLLAAGLLSLRAIARGLTLVAAGHPAPGVVLHARRGLIWLDTEHRAGRARSREERSDLARVGLGVFAAATAVSGAAFVLTRHAFARELAGVALLALLVDLTPYLWTDGRVLVHLAARVPDLGRRSRSWLLRRVVRNLRAHTAVGPLERSYLWVSTAWLVHALLSIAVLALGLLPPALDLALRAANRPDWLAGLLPALAILLVTGLLTAALLVITVGFGSQLLARRSSDDPLDARTLPETEVADFALAAAGIPFLARLGSDALRDLAACAQREQFAQGALVLRQGDPGDRFCFLASGHAIVRIEEESGLRHDVSQLGPGDFFGETALVEDVPRTASVLAAAPVVLYTLGRDQFLAVAAAAGADGAQVREQIRNAAVLRSHPLFQGLGAEGLRRLLERVEVYPCDQPEDILRQGDAGDTMYVIRQGHCTVTRHDSGEDRVIAQLLPNDWFGEIALLGSHVRTATVRAEAGTVLIEVPRDAVDEVLCQDLGAATQLAAIAAERIAGLRLGNRP